MFKASCSGVGLWVYEEPVCAWVHVANVVREAWRDVIIGAHLRRLTRPHCRHSLRSLQKRNLPHHRPRLEADHKAHTHTQRREGSVTAPRACILEHIRRAQAERLLPLPIAALVAALDCERLEFSAATPRAGRWGGEGGWESGGVSGSVGGHVGSGRI